MDFLSHPMSIFVLGMWFGVFWGIVILALFHKENKN